MAQFSLSDMILYGTWMIPLNVILIFFMVVFFAWNPKYLVKIYLRSRVWFYGFTKKQIQCDDLSISYIERGHLSMVTPSILFVHGYSSQKENWIDMMRNFPPQMHVVALDLPGHGDSEYKNQDLNIKFLTNILKQFIDHVGMSRRKFHFIGQSMGGCIAGMYACQHPDDLLSVNLFCPFGVNHKLIEQSYRTFQSTGKSSLLPQNMEQFEIMIKVLTHKKIPVVIPRIIKRGMLHLRLEKDAFYRKLLEGISRDVDFLAQSIHQIKKPILLYWGKEDKVLDVECVAILEKKIQCDHKKIVVLDKTGHVLSVESPKKSADIMLEFIHSLP